jgi:hypothetical protein
MVAVRTLSPARRLTFRLKSAAERQISFFTNDALRLYGDALLDVYGI